MTTSRWVASTRDRFEVHLRNLLNEPRGGLRRDEDSGPLSRDRGVEVCQVDVEPASQPVIIVTKDKNGQKLEKFYVRSGNASHEMPMSEMSAYVKERFH